MPCNARVGPPWVPSRGRSEAHTAARRSTRPPRPWDHMTPYDATKRHHLLRGTTARRATMRRCDDATLEWLAHGIAARRMTPSNATVRSEAPPRDARRSTPAARRSAPAARRSTLNARRPPRDARRSTLDARRSTLDDATLDAQRSSGSSRRRWRAARSTSSPPSSPPRAPRHAPPRSLPTPLGGFPPQ